MGVDTEPIFDEFILNLKSIDTDSHFDVLFKIIQDRLAIPFTCDPLNRDRNISVSREKQENLPPNVKNKIFCVLISMLETNIKRIIKLIDLLVKEGFSGHFDRGQIDRTLQWQSTLPWSGTFQWCCRPMWWNNSKFISRKFSRRATVFGEWVCFGCFWKWWKCCNQLHSNCNNNQFLFEFDMFPISFETEH